MYKKSDLLLMTLVGLCSLTLTACGPGGRSGSTSSYENAAADITASSFAQRASGDYGLDYPGGESYIEGEASYSGGDGSSNSVQLPEAERKLIRKVSMTITLSDDRSLAETSDSLVQMAAGLGGYISHRNLDFDTYYPGGALTVHIPKANVDTFLSKIGESELRVSDLQDNSEDVTSQYVDVNSRIRTKEIEKEKYESYLQSAENIEELLAVESRLHDVIADLEAYKSQLKSMEGQIEYTEVAISLRAEVSTKEPTMAERVGSRLLDIAENTLDSVLDGLEWFLSAAIYLVFALPLLFLIIRVVIFAANGRKNAAPKAPKQAKKPLQPKMPQSANTGSAVPGTQNAKPAGKPAVTEEAKAQTEALKPTAEEPALPKDEQTEAPKQ